MKEGQPRYDLEERTVRFGKNIISFAKKIPNNLVTQRLIPQIVGAGTSVGANYCEALDAESQKDFIHKAGICKKESKESKFFLSIIATAVPELSEEARTLWKEATELNLIFAASIRTARKKRLSENL